MPTIDISGCLANHWFIWTINGVGSILGAVVTMLVSFFLLKLFQNTPTSKPRTRPPEFEQFTPPENSMAFEEPPPGSWMYDNYTGQPYMVYG